MKNSKGITIIALIVTVVIMLILLSVTINVGANMINKTKLEDLKTDMLLLQSRVKVIAEKNNFEEAELSGIEIDMEDSQTTYVSDGDVYIISSDLFEKLQSDKEDKEEAGQEVSFYIWTEQIAGIEKSTDAFYVVDYKTGEIYFSDGYTKDNVTYFSLTQLQEL